MSSGKARFSGSREEEVEGDVGVRVADFAAWRRDRVRPMAAGCRSRFRSADADALTADEGAEVLCGELCSLVCNEVTRPAVGPDRTVEEGDDDGGRGLAEPARRGERQSRAGIEDDDEVEREHREEGRDAGDVDEPEGGSGSRRGPWSREAGASGPAAREAEPSAFR